ncbi:MAG: tetratricopeptide repeat protein [Acidobacteriia bacterium]|nr:tetratricopeptide repeat protein [Terriglobia bacterium]
MRCIAIFLITLSLLGSLACHRKVTSEDFLERGKQYLKEKDYARALIEFRNATKLKPKSPEAYFQSALAYIEMRDANAAVAFLMRAVEVDPKHTASQVKLAELMSGSKDREVLREGVEHAKAALQIIPNDPDALNALGLTEFQLGNHDVGLRYLEQANKVYPEHLKSSVSLAAVFLAKKDLAGAERILKEAAEKQAGSADGVATLGRFYVHIGKKEEAQKQFRRAIEIDPGHAIALLNLAALASVDGRDAEAASLYGRISKLPDKDYRQAYAIYLIQKRRQGDAIRELERLEKTDPTDRTVRTLLVTLYMAANRLPDAEKLLAAAIQRNSKDTEALLQRSEIHLRAGRGSEAQADLAEVLRVRPESGEAHYVAAKLARAGGFTKNYEQELGEALRLNRNLLGARLESVTLLLAQGRSKTALELLDQAPSAQKEQLPWILTRNAALLAAGKVAEVRKILDQVLPVHQTAALLQQDSTVRLIQKDYLRARTSAEEALRLDPESVPAIDHLFRSYAYQGKAEDGINRLRQLAAQQPKSAGLQMFLGRVLLATRRYDEARRAFQAALGAKGGAEASIGLVQVDLAEGKNDGARQILEQLIRSDDRNVAARMLLAQLHYKSGRLDDTVAQYRKILDIDQRNVRSLNNLAYVLADSGRAPDEALQYAQQAKELAPHDVGVEDTIGWAFYRKGIYPTAVRHLEKAVQTRPTALYRYHLAMAYMRAGTGNRGRAMLDVALREDPSLPEAKTAQDLLAQLSREDSGRVPR